MHKVMQKTTLNRVDEEEKSDGGKVNQPERLSDGANVSPLHAAAIMGNKVEMSVLLREHKRDIDKGDKIGRTPLIYSILGDRYECAEALLKAGADVNKTDVDKRTALHWAAYQGNLRLVKLLIDKGAMQGWQDKEGQTPLHLSLSHDNIKVMARLLKDADIDCCDGNGMTALHFSVAYERVEHTKMLLHAKASPGCLDKDKKTVLHWAKMNKDTIIVSKLLDYEEVLLILNSKDSEGQTAVHVYVASNNLKLIGYITSRSDCSLSEQDHMHRTPLHLAAVLGHTEIAKVLLRRGCDPLKPDNSGVRPLHYAAQNNFAETVNAMLMHENVKDVPDNNGRTALMWAAAKGAYDALKVLIMHKQDLLASDETGATALHMASEGGHLQCVNLLLQNHAGVNIVDNQQYTPLFSACQMGHKDVVETLLLNGAATDLEDKKGRTPLHWAAVGGITDICAMLISKGVDISKRDKLGRPVLHYAAYGGFYSCMAHLLDSGADVDARDNTGVTALHWACASGSLDAVKLLVKHNAFLNYVETEGDKLAPLDYAISGEHQDVVQFMIENGAYTITAIQDEAALVIQKTWRGYRLRRSFEEQKEFLILHVKRQKETKLKQGDAFRPAADDSVKDRNISNDEKFAEIFGRSFCQHDENVPKDVSGNAIKNAAIGKSGPIPQSFRSSLNEQVPIDANVHRRRIENENGFSLKKNSALRRNGDARSENGSESYGSLDSVNKSHSEFSPFKRRPFRERNVKGERIESEEICSDISTSDMIGTKSFPNDRQSKAAHKGIILSPVKRRGAERGQVLDSKAYNRLVAEKEGSDFRRPRNRTFAAMENNEEQEQFQKIRSISLSENMNVSARERTKKLLNASPTPSTSTSSLYSRTGDAELKPWEIYKRERHRKHLIRRKIESVVVIQRAFRNHLTKHGVNVSKSEDETCESHKEQENIAEQKGDEKHTQTVQEIAALTIQLHWRHYLKKRLVKQQRSESVNSDVSDSRLLIGRDRKPKITIHQRNPEPPQDTPRRKSSKSKQRASEHGANSLQPEGIELPNIVNGHHKPENTGKKTSHDHVSEQKSRPKSVLLNNRKGSKSGPKIPGQKQSRRSTGSSSQSGLEGNHPSTFKIHMPQSWASSLQRYPLRQ